MVGDGESDAGRFATVDALLQGGAPRIYPAATLLCQVGDRLAFSRVVGDASEATWFDLASLTKALCTSVLCMRAVQAGRVVLTDEVLPGVSVASLLRHESGWPAWLPLYQQAAGEGTGERSWATDRAAIVSAARSAPRGQVGQRAIYSDLGFILLADHLERVLDERLDVAFQRIATALSADVAYRPLDVPDAAQRVPAVLCAPTYSEGAVRTRLCGVVHDDNARALGGVAGHAGLFGTAQGVARIVWALCDCYHDVDTPRRRALGLSADIVRTFWGPAAGLAPGSTWALGWDHPSPPDQPSSAGRLWPRRGIGHLGFTGCSVWIDPGDSVTGHSPRGEPTFAIFLSNRVCVPAPDQATATQAAIKDLRPRLHDAIWSALYPAP